MLSPVKGKSPSVTKRSLVLHLLVFLWCCFGTYWDRTFYISSNFGTYGGRFKYCTMITLYVCLLSYCIAFIVDLIQTVTGALEEEHKQSNSILINLRDHLVGFWASNLSIFSVIMFWSVAAYNLEGIHPAEHQKLVPLFGWYNHYLHTIPALITILLLTNVRYQLCGDLKSIFLIVVFSGSYTAWMVHLASVNGEWPYDFIEKMNTQCLVLFVLFGMLFFYSVDKFNKKLVALVWETKSVNLKQKSR